jgi:hypothetical protein
MSIVCSPINFFIVLLIVISKEFDPQILFRCIQAGRYCCPAAVDEDFQDGGVAEDVDCEGL